MNRAVIIDLMTELTQYITLKEPPKGGLLSGRKFCQTGGLTRVSSAGKRVTRNDLIALIENAGGTWSDTVDKFTSLIIDDLASTSSKASKARKCGATLITEADFFKLLGD
jgi:NAD-dependent DNA ligase